MATADEGIVPDDRDGIVPDDRDGIVPDDRDGIVPDDKDWTWVLRRPCPECGFDAAGVDPTRAGADVRALAARFAAVLRRPGADHRRRPHRWSDLEYSCHVRDVFRRFDERLRSMLTEDDPLFANWDQDRTAVEERYGEQPPDVVANELEASAEALARRLDGVAPAQWGRTGRRSDGAAFTVDTLVRYLLHDPVHHLWDVDALG